jgi:hypothetical protein
MIDVHCPACGRVLIGSRQILALRAGEAGIEVAYVCWCGRPGAELVGRAAPAPSASGKESSPARVGG